MTRTDVGALVIGEALVDVVHDAAGGVVERPGGSPANVAVGLARLGRRTELLTRLGEDRHGDLVARHLRREGVGLVLPPQPGVATSSATAHLAADGSASYDFAIDWSLPPDPPRSPALLVHTGSLAAVLAPGCEQVVELLRHHADRATVTYDLNIRPSVTGDDAGLWTWVARVVALADVVKASDEDLAFLMPSSSVDAAAGRLLDLGPSAVVVTRGGEGATCLTRAGVTTVPAPRAAVADTIGAGDSFCSAVIDRLWDLDLVRATGKERLRELGTTTWTEILTYAAAAAAVTVGRPGADPPTRAEILVPEQV